MKLRPLYNLRPFASPEVTLHPGDRVRITFTIKNPDDVPIEYRMRDVRLDRKGFPGWATLSRPIPPDPQTRTDWFRIPGRETDSAYVELRVYEEEPSHPAENCKLTANCEARDPAGKLAPQSWEDIVSAPEAFEVVAGISKPSVDYELEVIS